MVRRFNLARKSCFGGRRMANLAAMRRGAGGPVGHWADRRPRLVACAVACVLAVSGPLAAQSRDAGAASVAARVASLDAGVEPAADAELLHKIAEHRQQVEAFLRGTLDPAVEAHALFDVDLSRPAAVSLEAARLRMLLLGRGDAGAAVATGGELWRQQLALDAARLRFYELSPKRRAELLSSHAERSARVRNDEASQALSRARAQAEKAERDKAAALLAAQQATSEAVRLVNEEKAHLLEITQHLADFEQRLIGERRALEARAEATLAWRRRIATLLGGEVDPRTADPTYAELRTALGAAREALSQSLGGTESELPRPEPTRLENLPADVDVSAVQAQRTEVLQKVIELEVLERELSHDQARQLMNQVEELNRLRLALLPHLSSDLRGRVLGFQLAGFQQAAAEVRQVVLVMRYHVLATFQWVADVARSGQRRNDSVLAGGLLLLKWLPPLAIFLWWRRRGDAVLISLREQAREAERRAQRPWLGASFAERAVVFARHVRTPLEALLFVKACLWMLPETTAALLEVKVVDTVLTWVFGSRLAVESIDAWSARESHPGASLRAKSVHSSLRLRSLYLVSRATVAFGLVLSLSQLLVGRGTVHSWVLSTCWLAAFPIFLTIIRWWRHEIFARLEGHRKKNPFELWLLSEREGLRGSIGAIAGGVYLFSMGVIRAAQVWIANFRIIRRFLAYLFRRDLNKKGLDAVSCGPLPPDTFIAMGPEQASAQTLQGVLKAEMDAAMARINAVGGGVVAVVGERGSGKSTLVRTLCRDKDEVIEVRCRERSLEAFAAALKSAVGLDPTTSLEQVAQHLDQKMPNSALVIDDAGLLIRPKMGGLNEFDQVLDLCRLYSSRCTWLFAFDHSLWQFLDRSRGVRPLFDEVLELRGWSEEHIVQLLVQRNGCHDLHPSFERLLTNLPDDADEIDRREALQRTEANYYRLIWDYSNGNPSVALHFWRRSLGVAPDGSLQVQYFDPADADDLEGLPDSAVFVLRAIVQLGWAGAVEVQEVTSLPVQHVQDVLRYGGLRGFFERRGDQYRLSWDWFRAVTRMLTRRHLLSLQQ